MDRIGMGCGGEYAVAQFDVEERRERVDDEDVGVEIQGSDYVGVDVMRRQHAVVHLLRVSLASTSMCEERLVHHAGCQLDLDIGRCMVGSQATCEPRPLLYPQLDE